MKYQLTIVSSVLVSLAGFYQYGVKQIPKININTSSILHQQSVLPLVEVSDIIYHTRSDRRSFIPVVNEEFKTVFFSFGKCASTEWKRMFVRMTGNPRWCGKWIHKKEVNGLKWLNDYSLKEAQRIMTSPEWTRAVFVRNPKDRLLSAFLDKAVKHSANFTHDTCGGYSRLGGNRQECIDHHLEFGFFLENITTVFPTNVHWMQLYDQIDDKWWPYINYIGYMENIAEDAKSLLQSITSNKDGISAWERCGITGWGINVTQCASNNGTEPFMGKIDTKHETDAHEKLRAYYTPELEMFVNNKYSKDLNNSYFQFSSVEIFPHNRSTEREEDNV